MWTPMAVSGYASVQPRGHSLLLARMPHQVCVLANADAVIVVPININGHYYCYVGLVAGAIKSKY